MTEDEAKTWVAERYDPVALDRLDRLVDMTIAENHRQNLIAPSTITDIWSRHIVDSLQLLRFAPAGRWLDIGSGAGFPGLVVAVAEPDRAVTLVEPRRLRADYLDRCADALLLTNIDVRCAKIDQVTDTAEIISARAVAKAGKLFEMAGQCAMPTTVWLLPKGRTADLELAEARQKWQGVFHVEQSITSLDSRIVIAHQVRRR